MRERAENELHIPQRGVVWGDKRNPTAVRQLGGCPALLIGRGEPKRKPRMSRDESTELPSRITTGSEHSNRDSMH